MAIEDKKEKKKRPNPPPDTLIPLPDRSRQAERKVEIPKEAPERNVKKLEKLIVRAIRNKTSAAKIRMPTSRVVDVGPPASNPFKGKGRRLADEEEERPRGITTQFDKKAGAAANKRRAATASRRNDQLAIMA